MHAPDYLEASPACQIPRERSKHGNEIDSQSGLDDAVPHSGFDGELRYGGGILLAHDNDAHMSKVFLKPFGYFQAVK